MAQSDISIIWVFHLAYSLSCVGGVNGEFLVSRAQNLVFDNAEWKCTLILVRHYICALFHYC